MEAVEADKFLPTTSAATLVKEREANSWKTILKPDFYLLTDIRLSCLDNISPCNLNWRTLYHSQKFTWNVLGMRNPITYRPVSRIGSKFLTSKLITSRPSSHSECGHLWCGHLEKVWRALGWQRCISPVGGDESEHDSQPARESLLFQPTSRCTGFTWRKQNHSDQLFFELEILTLLLQNLHFHYAAVFRHLYLGLNVGS